MSKKAVTNSFTVALPCEHDANYLMENIETDLIGFSRLLYSIGDSAEENTHSAIYAAGDLAKMYAAKVAEAIRLDNLDQEARADA